MRLGRSFHPVSFATLASGADSILRSFVRAIPTDSYVLKSVENSYLGTLVHEGSHRWMGGVLALVAIFLPGWLLVGGAWHLWPLLREKPWARGLEAGAHAGVVGLLLAALYRPLCTENLGNLRDAAAAVAATLLVGPCRVPPWAVVAVMAVVGQWALR